MNKPAVKQGARHSAEDNKIIQRMHDDAISLGAMCQGESDNAKATATANGKKSVFFVSALRTRMDAFKALADVNVETWDVQNACAALAQIASLISSEAGEGEADDVAELIAIAGAIVDFIGGELGDMLEDIQDEMMPETPDPDIETVTDTAAALADAAEGEGKSAKAISKREDVNPKEGTNKYGDVKFADEKNKKYPIDTADHIRAAWNYANKPGNAGKYSADEIAQIKRKIIAAWKDKIDKAGPPSAQDKSLNFTYIKSLHLTQAEEQLRDVIAAKFVGDDTIRGYLALWGDPERVDVEDDFFTKSTDFWDARLALPKPLTWDHAQDPATKSAPIVGSIVEMGDDDIGRWYSAQLDRNYKYRKAIDALISKRAVGTSSDSAPQYVVREKAKSGANWLKQWPLFAAALTTTPCEPRMFEEGSLHWKSIGLDPATHTPDGARLDSHIAELTRKYEELSKVWNGLREIQK